MSRTRAEISKELEQAMKLYRQYVAQYSGSNPNHPLIGQAEAQVKHLERELNKARS